MAPITRHTKPITTPQKPLRSNDPPSSNTRKRNCIEHDTPRRVRVKTFKEAGKTVAWIEARTGVPERSQRRFDKEDDQDRRIGKERHSPAYKIGPKLVKRMITYLR